MTTPPLAVVTGASSGIGASFAVALAQRGHHVMAVARRRDRLTALASAHPGLITPVALDLTAPDAVDELGTRIAAHGPVDLLVSNAGRGAHGRAWEISREVTGSLLGLNVLSGTDLALSLLPGMIARRRGGLIFVASSGGFYPTPHLAAYGASKAFLVSFAEALSAELAGTGVRAMALCPGPTSTEFGDVAGMADLLAAAPGLATPDAVVTAGLRAFARGRTLCVPGATTAATTSVLARLPRALTRRLMERTLRA